MTTWIITWMDPSFVLRKSYTPMIPAEELLHSFHQYCPYPQGLISIERAPM
jgi:hypothetical protein